MKIAWVNMIYDAGFADEEELLRTYYTCVGWAEALQKAGATVTVISRFHKDSRTTINNVEYIFVSDGLKAQLDWWEIPLGFLKAAARLNVDVIHLHQFTRSPQTLALRFLLNRKTAIIIQHHGGKSHNGWKMRVHNKINSLADGYFFTSVEQGIDWFKNKKQSIRVMQVMEGATFFEFETRDADRPLYYQDRESFRKLSGMYGEPVFLWVGRLDENKDPVTVLQGFEILLQIRPQAKLYMIYGESRLERKVWDIIENSAHLKEQVVLLGRVAHQDLEVYYNSADYFVLGSHYEGSSFALSEALSCGCIPIVTNIPSLRMMTDKGRLGALWQPDDKNSLANAATIAMEKPRIAEAESCIAYYKEHLSFDAIARVALSHYKEAVQLRVDQ
jgi:glycosyltransferase involved in cell wall biosynthesis